MDIYEKRFVKNLMESKIMSTPDAINTMVESLDELKLAIITADESMKRKVVAETCYEVEFLAKSITDYIKSFLKEEENGEK